MLSKQELYQFVKEQNFQSAEDNQKTLKELFADVLQEALEAELDTHLGYEKHESKNKQTTNSRNGYSKKTVTSDYGDVEIEVARDRLGEFEPVFVKKNQMNVTGIEDQIIVLYGKGVSTRSFRIAFKGSADVSVWAQSGVADSVQAGIASGRRGGTLAPKTFVTRAEVAAMVWRLLQKSDLI